MDALTVLAVAGVTLGLLLYTSTFCLVPLQSKFLQKYQELNGFLPPFNRAPLGLPGRGLIGWRILTNPLHETIMPEQLLCASGEVWGVTFVLAWTLTAIFNPGTIANNPIKDRIGYNNVCVGFDTAPANFICLPLITLSTVFGFAAAFTDIQRAVLERSTDGPSARSLFKFRLTICVDIILMASMLCLPLLLLIDPTVSPLGHLLVFIQNLISRLLSFVVPFIRENAQRDQITRPRWLFLMAFAGISMILPVCWLIDFILYDPKQISHPINPIFLCIFDWSWVIFATVYSGWVPQFEAISIQFRLIQLNESGDQENADTKGIAFITHAASAAI
ncbi:hypothetical protein AB1Y20_004800 [Prymnesium parvum]|uniref:Uncharacterized protein n=1 Tax=Prymnesium parvum TaxID=97485 RepID=A0AB34IXL5_PRYPA